MNYIGSKVKLLSFLHSVITNVVGSDLSDKVFCDIFAGTGAVGRSFKSSVKKIISNDCEYYSYVLNKNYIGNHVDIIEKDVFLNELQCLSPKDDGFIYKNYCKGGGTDRLYFSDYNGQMIDAIRSKIEYWKKSQTISDNLYYYLLCSLLEGSDKVANTASVYGAYLKHLKKTAENKIKLLPAKYELNSNSHDVYMEDANKLILKINGDILYLDPPYNARQYGANYHLLNTIAEYKPFNPFGKTGLRKYDKSKYCSGNYVETVFENLIKNAAFKYIFLSYNNEGLMSFEKIKSIMSKYGKYDVVQKDYQRFKADKSENRNNKADSTIEYVHILEKIN
jgi:adenine-specific DNA-methyltransferase